MANSKVKITSKPQQPFAYQGNQVIINTDRVVMQFRFKRPESTSNRTCFIR